MVSSAVPRGLCLKLVGLWRKPRGLLRNVCRDNFGTTWVLHFGYSTGTAATAAVSLCCGSSWSVVADDAELGALADNRSSDALEARPLEWICTSSSGGLAPTVRQPCRLSRTPDKHSIGICGFRALTPGVTDKSSLLASEAAVRLPLPLSAAAANLGRGAVARAEALSATTAFDASWFAPAPPFCTPLWYSRGVIFATAAIAAASAAGVSSSPIALLATLRPANDRGGTTTRGLLVPSQGACNRRCSSAYAP
mmetsp:Transcript_45772/g.83869  ORF Transcript_45772/g.83869 Transcript_45772/m.83869 type:complete len:252 (-) Transcript_45772:140-895(-)